jgi:hypothetical protein
LALLSDSPARAVLHDVASAVVARSY